MKRGEIWLANFNPTRGSEVGKTRPALVIQADFVSAHGASTVIVLPLTTQVRASMQSLRITIKARDRLLHDCQVMPEQPRTLDRKRLIEGPLAALRESEMAAIEKPLKAILGLDR